VAERSHLASRLAVRNLYSTKAASGRPARLGPVAAFCMSLSLVLSLLYKSEQHSAHVLANSPVLLLPTALCSLCSCSLAASAGVSHRRGRTMCDGGSNLADWMRHVTGLADWMRHVTGLADWMRHVTGLADWMRHVTGLADWMRHVTGRMRHQCHTSKISAIKLSHKCEVHLEDLCPLLVRRVRPTCSAAHRAPSASRALASVSLAI